MKYYFSSDYHLGHANIIIYTKRPQLREEDLNEKGMYKSKEIAEMRCKEMDKMIIDNHNGRVKPEDTLFHIGDLMFRNSKGGKIGEGLNTNAKHYLDQLNGNIVLWKGNHENSNSINAILLNAVINYGGHKIFMCHNPKDANKDYAINLIGHIHQAWKIKKIENSNSYMINVGVDVWNYRPVTINEIIGLYIRTLRGIR